ncbi:MAG: hypothetical protein EXS63_04435 [Candidatus Omnitrophica bacterium]|nr:hypothetical protein [Candidatus Omnitrophota bacterium]
MKRLIAAGTLFFFLSTDCWGSIPGIQIGVILHSETVRGFHVEIPQDLARVEKVFDAKNSDHPRVIFHIQDAHGHYGAQIQTKKILDYLSKQYGVRQIFVEGAASEARLDPKPVQIFKEKEKNLKIADTLAKYGMLTGADLYLVEKGNAVRADGIENPELYHEAYQALQEVFKASPETDDWIKNYFSRLDQIASRLLPPDLREALHEQQKFEDGNRDFIPYVKNLAALSKKHLKFDLQDLYSQLEYPQAARVLGVQSMEKGLKLEEARKEKEKLIQFLKLVIASKAKQSPGSPRRSAPRDDIQFIENFKIEMNTSPDSQASLRSFFENFSRTAGPKGFHFHDYPNFSLYAGYRILLSEIETDKLFEEVQTLFKKILNQLAQTEEQKEILGLYQDGALLRKLLKLELNRREWERVEARAGEIEPEKIVRRIESGVKGQRAESRERSEDKGTKDKPSALSAMHYAYFQALNFYTLSLKRETVFYQTLDREMQKRHLTKVVLVTGGFHTDGMDRVFQKNGISYATITPQISGGFKEASQVYRSVMLQGGMGQVLRHDRSPSEAANLMSVNLLQPSDFIKQMAGRSELRRWNQQIIRANPQNSDRSEVRAYQPGAYEDPRDLVDRGPMKSISPPVLTYSPRILFQELVKWMEFASRPKDLDGLIFWLERAARTLEIETDVNKLKANSVSEETYKQFRDIILAWNDLSAEVKYPPQAQAADPATKVLPRPAGRSKYLWVTTDEKYQFRHPDFPDLFFQVTTHEGFQRDHKFNRFRIVRDPEKKLEIGQIIDGHNQSRVFHFVYDDFGGRPVGVLILRTRSYAIPNPDFRGVVSGISLGLSEGEHSDSAYIGIHHRSVLAAPPAFAGKKAMVQFEGEFPIEARIRRKRFVLILKRNEKGELVDVAREVFNDQIGDFTGEINRFLADGKYGRASLGAPLSGIPVADPEGKPIWMSAALQNGVIIRTDEWKKVPPAAIYDFSQMLPGRLVPRFLDRVKSRKQHWFIVLRDFKEKPVDSYKLRISRDVYNQHSGLITGLDSDQRARVHLPDYDYRLPLKFKHHPVIALRFLDERQILFVVYDKAGLNIRGVFFFPFQGRRLDFSEELIQEELQLRKKYAYALDFQEILKKSFRIKKAKRSEIRNDSAGGFEDGDTPVKGLDVVLSGNQKPAPVSQVPGLVIPRSQPGASGTGADSALVRSEARSRGQENALFHLKVILKAAGRITRLSQDLREEAIADFAHILKDSYPANEGKDMAADIVDTDIEQTLASFLHLGVDSSQNKVNRWLAGIIFDQPQPMSTRRWVVANETFIRRNEQSEFIYYVDRPYRVRAPGLDKVVPEGGIAGELNAFFEVAHTADAMAPPYGVSVYQVSKSIILEELAKNPEMKQLVLSLSAQRFEELVLGMNETLAAQKMMSSIPDKNRRETLRALVNDFSHKNGRERLYALYGLFSVLDGSVNPDREWKTLGSGVSPIGDIGTDPLERLPHYDLFSQDLSRVSRNSIHTAIIRQSQLTLENSKQIAERLIPKGTLYVFTNSLSVPLVAQLLGEGFQNPILIVAGLQRFTKSESEGRSEVRGNGENKYETPSRIAYGILSRSDSESLFRDPADIPLARELIRNFIALFEDPAFYSNLIHQAWALHFKAPAAIAPQQHLFPLNLMPKPLHFQTAIRPGSKISAEKISSAFQAQQLLSFNKVLQNAEFKHEMARRLGEIDAALAVLGSGAPAAKPLSEMEIDILLQAAETIVAFYLGLPKNAEDLPIAATAKPIDVAAEKVKAFRDWLQTQSGEMSELERNLLLTVYTEGTLLQLSVSEKLPFGKAADIFAKRIPDFPPQMLAQLKDFYKDQKVSDRDLRNPSVFYGKRIIDWGGPDASARAGFLTAQLDAFERELIRREAEKQKGSYDAVMSGILFDSDFRVAGVEGNHRMILAQWMRRSAYQLARGIYDVLNARGLTGGRVWIDTESLAISEFPAALMMLNPENISFEDFLPWEETSDIDPFDPKWADMKKTFQVEYLSQKPMNRQILRWINSAKLIVYWELEALGATDIRVEKDPEAGLYQVHFKWAHEETDKAGTERTLIYRQVDSADFAVTARGAGKTDVYFFSNSAKELPALQKEIDSMRPRTLLAFGLRGGQVLSLNGYEKDDEAAERLSPEVAIYKAKPAAQDTTSPAPSAPKELTDAEKESKIHDILSAIPEKPKLDQLEMLWHQWTQAKRLLSQLPAGNPLQNEIENSLMEMADFAQAEMEVVRSRATQVLQMDKNFLEKLPADVEALLKTLERDGKLKVKQVKQLEQFSEIVNRNRSAPSHYRYVTDIVHRARKLSFLCSVSLPAPKPGVVVSRSEVRGREYGGDGQSKNENDEQGLRDLAQRVLNRALGYKPYALRSDESTGARSSSRAEVRTASEDSKLWTQAVVKDAQLEKVMTELLAQILPAEKKILNLENVRRLLSAAYKAQTGNQLYNKHPQIQPSLNARLIQLGFKDKEGQEPTLSLKEIKEGLVAAVLRDPKLKKDLSKKEQDISSADLKLILPEDYIFGVDADVYLSASPFQFMMFQDRNDLENSLVFQVKKGKLWIQHTQDAAPRILEPNNGKKNLVYLYRDASIRRFDASLQKEMESFRHGTDQESNRVGFAGLTVEVYFEEFETIQGWRPKGQSYNGLVRKVIWTDSVKKNNQVLTLSTIPGEIGGFSIDGLTLKSSRGEQPFIFSLPPTYDRRGPPTVNLSRILDLVRRGVFAKLLKEHRIELLVDDQKIQLDRIRPLVTDTGGNLKRQIKSYAMWEKNEGTLYPYRFYPLGVTVGDEEHPPLPFHAVRQVKRSELRTKIAKRLIKTQVPFPFEDVTPRSEVRMKQNGKSGEVAMPPIRNHGVEPYKPLARDFEAVRDWIESLAKSSDYLSRERIVFLAELLRLSREGKTVTLRPRAGLLNGIHAAIISRIPNYERFYNNTTANSSSHFPVLQWVQYFVANAKVDEILQGKSGKVSPKNSGNASVEELTDPELMAYARESGRRLKTLGGSKLGALIFGALHKRWGLASISEKKTIAQQIIQVHRVMGQIRARNHSGEKFNEMQTVAISTALSPYFEMINFDPDPSLQLEDIFREVYLASAPARSEVRLGHLQFGSLIIGPETLRLLEAAAAGVVGLALYGVCRYLYHGQLVRDFTKILGRRMTGTHLERTFSEGKINFWNRDVQDFLSPLLRSYRPRSGFYKDLMDYQPADLLQSILLVSYAGELSSIEPLLEAALKDLRDLEGKKLTRAELFKRVDAIIKCQWDTGRPAIARKVLKAFSGLVEFKEDGYTLQLRPSSTAKPSDLSTVDKHHSLLPIPLALDSVDFGSKQLTTAKSQEILLNVVNRWDERLKKIGLSLDFLARTTSEKLLMAPNLSPEQLRGKSLLELARILDNERCEGIQQGIVESVHVESAHRMLEVIGFKDVPVLQEIKAYLKMARLKIPKNLRAQEIREKREAYLTEARKKAGEAALRAGVNEEKFWNYVHLYLQQEDVLRDGLGKQPLILTDVYREFKKRIKDEDVWEAFHLRFSASAYRARWNTKDFVERDSLVKTEELLIAAFHDRDKLVPEELLPRTSLLGDSSSVVKEKKNRSEVREVKLAADNPVIWSADLKNVPAFVPVHSRTRLPANLQLATGYTDQYPVRLRRFGNSSGRVQITAVSGSIADLEPREAEPVLREVENVLTQESEFVARTKKILPVENGAGAVIRLSDRLPTAEELEMLKLNFRNPNHREVWVVLTKSGLKVERLKSEKVNSKTEIASDRLKIVFVPQDAGAKRRIVQIKDQLLKAVNQLPETGSKISSVILSGSKPLLDLIDAEQISPVAIETGSYSSSESRLAEQLILGIVADRISSNAELTLKEYLELAGKYQKVRSSAIEFYTGILRQLHAELRTSQSA